ncbi:MAG: hypothetical protein QOC73_758 [Actinomycetota bacterium]|nr:hypothetical protein [Actinomycetota bacterium]
MPRLRRRLAPLTHLPRSTVRLRLTLLYGLFFLLCGAGLLTINYVLMVHATKGFIFTSESNGVAVGVTQGKSTTVQIQGSSGPTVKAPLPGILTPQEAQQAGLPAEAEALRAQATRQHSAELHQLLLQSGIALGVMAVISLALGWLVAGRVLRPLRTITTAVREISATNLHKRLALNGPDDELKELGDTFDDLVSRLDSAFQAQRRFVANASHELRTPLARQRTLAQVALADPDATFESLRTAHERVLAAGSEQEQLIEALLTLARGQAGINRHDVFDLAAVTGRVVESLGTEATRRGLDLDVSLTPAMVTGDPRLVERLVTNLVDNALRHNVARGHVYVGIEATPGHAVLSVRNTGPVVPDDAVSRLFQPFRRIEADRTVRGEGLGLGLSIVQAIADAHGATITTHAAPQGGLQVDVEFPIGTPSEEPLQGVKKIALAVTAPKPVSP